MTSSIFSFQSKFEKRDEAGRQLETVRTNHFSSLLKHFLFITL